MKKLTAFIIAVMLILGTATLAYAENATYNLGDVNLDNTISISDATDIQFHLSQTALLNETAQLYADVDADGKISVIDATIIQLYLAQLIDTLPHNREIVGKISDDNSIILSRYLPFDSYTLRYEDENGALSDYADICTLSLDETSRTAIYSSFIAQNTAPIEATKIGVYDSNNERIGHIELVENLTADLGEKLYTFSALSDIHVGLNENNKEYYLTSTTDFVNALQYLNNEVAVDFNTICGDLTVYASENELSYYKSMVDEYSADTTVYVAAGNHEEYKAYTSEILHIYTENPLFYYFEQGDDVFIMVGVISSFEYSTFLEGELQWLYEVLEANRNKRCFVFEHVPTDNGSGDALGLHTGSKLGSYRTSLVFKNLLSHYQNTIFFHGHTHMQFALQQYNDIANYDDTLGIHSVHIPSLSVPRGVNEDGKRVSLFEQSEGYVVEVYENSVLLKGRDFVNGKFLPIAQYNLDTTLKTVEPNTFVDTLGVIDTNVTPQNQ